MRRKVCDKCGHDLDSSNHFLQCIQPKGTWKSSREESKKASEWD